MYEEFYQLREKPFRLSADSRFFFESGGHKRALAYLSYGLEQKEGFIVIAGSIGAGKTTLLEKLISQIRDKRIVVAKLVSTQLEPDDFLHMVAAAFKLTHEPQSKAGILKGLSKFFQQQAMKNEGVLLVVDEAQNLPKRSLNELLTLTYIHAEGVPGMQVVLLGQNELLATLKSPEMEEFRQHIITTYTLQGMTKEETRRYIEHRMKLVGWKGDPAFSADAHDEIFAQTGGVPRRINTFCNRLLLYGYLEELHAFTRETVRVVADELKTELGQKSGGLSYPDDGPAAAPEPEASMPLHEESAPVREATAAPDAPDAPVGASQAPDSIPVVETVPDPVAPSEPPADPVDIPPPDNVQAVPAGPAPVATASETPGGARQRRVFALDQSTIALVGAVILVVVVYLIVLPNRAPDDSEQDLGLSSVSGEKVTGSLELRTPPAADVGQGEGAPSGPDMELKDMSPPSMADSGLPQEAAPETPRAAAAPVAPVVDNKSVAAAGSAAAVRADRASGDRLAAAGSPEPAARAKAPPTGAGGAGDSPARKLESLRQQLQADDPVASPTTVPSQETNRVPVTQTTPGRPVAPRTPPKPAEESSRTASAEPRPSAASVPASPPADRSPAPPSARQDNSITIQELDRLAGTFSRAYEAGDLSTLVGLFAEDASTNDQNDRAGIARDYQELFQLSERRSFTISRLRWEQDSGDGLKGEGDFQANVVLKNGQGVTSVDGKVVFHVKKGPDGVQITEMLHTYN
ncbi:MAG: AAA family ATPase [Gammaproteobacteria bacterium]|nr:AAA family ATPase [Gammaproteobacteria bacterium]